MGPTEGRRFDGLVAIVTGSAWGMGKCHAERLAAEGAKVVLADLQEDMAAEVAAALPDAIAVRCDVSDNSETERMAAMTLERYGRIDIIVNNAGGSLVPPVPVWQMPEADWDRIIAANLKGVWLATRAVVPAMIEQGRGKIVNISSAGVFSGTPGRAAYIASKGGIASLTRTMAGELGPHGITVNTVAPGMIEIPHPKTSYSAQDWENMKTRGMQIQAIKRIGQMDDVSSAVLFFASAESDFVTGQLMVVDGGVSYH